MLHKKLAELLPLGDQEIERIVDFSHGEIDGADQILAAGGDVEIIFPMIDGQDVKLPRLAAIEDAQRVGFDLDLVQIDDAGGADVLLDPCVLDGSRIDAEEPLGQIAEWTMTCLLDVNDLIDLGRGENALLNQQLSDLYPGQWTLLGNVPMFIGKKGAGRKGERQIRFNHRGHRGPQREIQKLSFLILRFDSLSSSVVLCVLCG